MGRTSRPTGWCERVAIRSSRHPRSIFVTEKDADRTPAPEENPDALKRLGHRELEEELTVSAAAPGRRQISRFVRLLFERRRRRRPRR